jgi:phosphoglycerate kinase
MAGDKLKLPTDSRLCRRNLRVCRDPTMCLGAIPDGQMGLDIGPETIKAYEQIIASAKTVAWNGPMGVFETPPFDRGTIAIARAVAQATENGAVTIIGGGDSAAADRPGGLERTRCRTSPPAAARRSNSSKAKAFAALAVLDEN